MGICDIKNAPPNTRQILSDIWDALEFEQFLQSIFCKVFFYQSEYYWR